MNSMPTSVEKCSAKCCELSLTPFQPTNPSVLNKFQQQQGKRCRNFSPNWYSTYSWLTLCTTKCKAFCVLCRYCAESNLLCFAKKGDDAFVSNGFNNWKKALERFSQHSQSDLHKESILKIQLINQKGVDTLNNEQIMVSQRNHRQMLIKQLSSLKFLLRQGLAIRGHDEIQSNLVQLLNLRSNDCSELNNWIRERKYMSPDIVNDQIKLIADSVLTNIIADIRKVHWFSIIADEATDVSNKEQLTVCIRWVDDDFCIYEDPIELIQLPKTDAETITRELKSCLGKHVLPIAQCRGQAYDGASNMSGHLNGVAARIEKDVPAALYLHCFAHCTNLCLQTVGRKCVVVRDALDLVMEISQLIRFSPKRSTLFSDVQKELGACSVSLKPLCPTRWTVRTAAISAVLSNYSNLLAALEQINAETHDDYGRKAGGYLAQMDKFSTFFGLKLAHLIFSGTEQLSLTLQGKDTTIQEAVNATELAVKYLTRLRSDSTFVDFYSKTVEEAKELTSDPVLPRYRRPPHRIDDGEAPVLFSDPKSYFKQQYFEILDLLVNELKRRFQQKRGLPVMSVLEKTLLDSANGKFCALELPEEFDIYNSDLDLSRLKIQLTMLPDLITTHNTNCKVPIKKVTNVRTICDIINEPGKVMFSEVIKLLKIFYTLPVTTSTAERSFLH